MAVVAGSVEWYKVADDAGPPVPFRRLTENFARWLVLSVSLIMFAAIGAKSSAGGCRLTPVMLPGWR